MLRNKMACFIAKRVLIWCSILSIIDIIWLKNRWYILVGLLIGGIISIVKFGSYIWVFKRVFAPGIARNGGKAGASGSIVAFALNQIILFPLLYLAYILNHWFFAGVVSGILLVPFVIMINCITEVCGITKNNFE